MTLQEEMFALVSEWKTTGLSKKAFLQDKAIKLPKFNYWCEKHSRHMTSINVPSLHEKSHFRELIIEDGNSGAGHKLLELTTPSGLRITVFG